jgi:hypothetical protein
MRSYAPAGTLILVGAVAPVLPLGVMAAGGPGPRVPDPLWTLQLELAASNGAVGDGFGYSVAVSGDTAAIGASSKNSGQGAAYAPVAAEVGRAAGPDCFRWRCVSRTIQ